LAGARASAWCCAHAHSGTANDKAPRAEGPCCSLGSLTGLRRHLSRRSDESLAKRSQPGKFVLAQFVVTIGEVPHRFVEPLGLMVGICADDATLDDLLIHLVAGFIENRRLRCRYL